MNGVNGSAPALKDVLGGGGVSNTYLDGRTLSPNFNQLVRASPRGYLSLNISTDFFN